MSKYHGYQTCFSDTELLCKALHEVSGYKADVHETAINLYGYHGDVRPETAEVVVPRQQISSAANDLGFKRNTAGSYDAIISAYDRHRHGDEWMGKLKMSYGVAATYQKAKLNGFHVKEDQTTTTSTGTRRRIVLSQGQSLL
jgi:hypothetical protein